MLLWERVVEDAIVDWEVVRCGVRKLELSQISMSLLSSPAVRLVLVEMIGLYFGLVNFRQDIANRGNLLTSHLG